jgi:hypothetical protein
MEDFDVRYVEAGPLLMHNNNTKFRLLRCDFGTDIFGQDGSRKFGALSIYPAHSPMGAYADGQNILQINSKCPQGPRQ